MALRSILAASAAGLIATLSQPAAAQERHFNIPAQPIASAIVAFGRQSGIQVVAPVDLPANTTSRPVTGEMNPRVALTALIAGLGLEIVSDQGSAIVLRRTSPTISDTETAGEDILVTAQRRSERLKDVPVAVTVLGSRQIEQQRIQNIGDVARVTPGLLVSSFNYSSPTIAVRGASNTFNQIGVNRPVAVVLDDVFITRASAAVFQLFDLDTIQVLRGPQGTLFGRNVTGGAIVLTTRKPSFDQNQLSGSVAYGNYNDVELNGLVSGAVSDDLAVKAVVSRVRHDGYGYDRLSGAAEDNLDSINSRVQLRARAGRFETLFSLDYDSDSTGERTLSSLGVGNDGNRRTSELGIRQNFDRHIWGISNNSTYSLTGSGTIHAITAYRASQSTDYYSQTGVNYLFLKSGAQNVLTDADDVKDFSEEVRYESPRWKLGNFVAGVYYLHEDASRQLGTVGLRFGTGAVTTNRLANQAVLTDSISGYADGTINLPLHFRLTVGGRYTSDKKVGNLVNTDYLTATNSFATGDLSHRWGQFTPRAILAWQPTSDLLAYASWSKGFTSGGYNTEAANLRSIVTPFDPEKVTNYEVGIKADLLRRRLSFNTAAFWMNYRDKQEFVQNTITGVGTITNAGKGRARGVEVEVTTRPIDGLVLSGMYAYLDTTYLDFFIPGIVNNTGHPLGSSPPSKASGTVFYERPIAALGFVNLNATYAWTDGYYTGATQNSQLFVPRYGLLNGSVGFETADRKFRLSFWGKNLTNKDFLLTPGTVGVLSEYLGPPRTFGATIAARY